MLLELLIAHIITDFFIRPDIKMIKNSENPDAARKDIKYLLFHTLITAIGAIVAVHDIKKWPIVLIITITHFLIDAYKIYLTKDTTRDFIIDQILHLIVLLACSNLLFNNESIDQAIAFLDKPQIQAIIMGYLLITMPTGILIGKLTEPFRKQITNNDGLEQAGVWIGNIERILVFTFVLLNQISAIGLLIAAKSFLRFSDKSSSDLRKQTEYIIIGTFLSFGIALISGLLIRNFYI